MVKDLQNRIPELSEHIEFNKLNNKEFILSNLKHKHYLKINSETYNLLNLIDGKRNLNCISQLFNDKFQQKITLKQLEKALSHNLCKFKNLGSYNSRDFFY